MSTVTPSFFKGADRRLISAILHGPRIQWLVWGGFAKLDALTGKVDTSQPRLVFVLMSGHVGQEMLKFSRGLWTNAEVRRQGIGQGEPVARNFHTEVFPAPRFEGN